MLSKILTYSFYLLFALTPLIWAPWSFELFEFNKMMFVYLLTLVISACWVLKMISEKQFILKTTPLDLPLLIFLAANILSTIFSIDRHISIFGYYSRLNGGLLSIISYILLYYALISNFDKEQAIKFLKAAVLGAVPVALWAIPEHFGVSPSCIILTGRADVSCWVQDVQARVFATLGQPNWLAAYLAMLIFPAIYFAFTTKPKFSTITYNLAAITFYLAFTFTYSRGATLGLLAGLFIFLALIIWQVLRLHLGGVKLNLGKSAFYQWKSLTIILAIIILISLTFGTALTDFKLVSKFAPPSRPSLTTSIKSGTQLENGADITGTGGTESGKIRLIVWQGAIDIFKAYPLFGSGVETFAYSYYQFRPVEHNLVSEWDFLYNKAHNEFLNYLATTGILGFLSYMLVILTLIIWSLGQIFNFQVPIFIEFSITKFSFKNLINKNSLKISTLRLHSGLMVSPSVLRTSGSKDKVELSNFKFQIKNTSTHFILLGAILASYISYLVQNFFGFSVVNIALLFFLFPALAFLTTGSTKPFILPKKLYALRSTLYPLIYKRPFYAKLAQATVVLIFGLLIFTLSKFYLADIYFAKGMKFSDTNPGKAYNALYQAAKLNPLEPLYISELGFQSAAAAVSLGDGQASLSAQLKDQAAEQTLTLLSQNPNNVSYFRTAVRTYYMLSTLDQSFIQKTLETIDSALRLAPTDAKLLYNKSIILSQNEQREEAIKSLEKTLKLRPNYKEAREALEKLNEANR